METAPEPPPAKTGIRYPFRRAVLRGMAIVLPPLLTIVIFLWVGSTVQVYVLKPVKDSAREALVWWVSDVRENPTREEQILVNQTVYQRLQNGQYIPAQVLSYLEQERPDLPEPSTPGDAFRQYVETRFLQDYIVLPVFLLCFVLLLYLLGKSLAVGFGRFFWNIFERGILQLPLVRTVYRSSKQVTNFMFNQGEIQFLRVVAVEYPRDRLWTVGLVTGEGLRSVNSHLSEETVSVMLPCSPMPVTGYAVVVPVRKTIPLDMSIDQALQFIVSCGVVNPHQFVLDPVSSNAASSSPNDARQQGTSPGSRS